ncbi:MAG: hypothetical protein ACYC5G_04180 [Candidatus Doudnabacteria bacterium]
MPKSYSLQIDKTAVIFDNAGKCPWRIFMSHDHEASEPTREGTFRAFVEEFGKPVLLVVMIFVLGYCSMSSVRVNPNNHQTQQAP